MKHIFIIFVILLSFSVSLKSQNINFDKKLGAKNALAVERQMGIYNDTAMNAYINSIGQRLVSKLDTTFFDYHFILVPQKVPNSFALPGGYIYVTTGIIPLLESEDELACILGHEITHSQNRHGVKQIRMSLGPKLALIPGNLVGIINKNLGELLNAPITVSSALMMASYSRKHETEADDVGIELAAAAGYNPFALADALGRMTLAVEVATGNKEQKSYFTDHPYTPDRNKNIKVQAKELSIVPTKNISTNYLMEFNGIMFGDSPSQGVIRKNKFLHPDIDFYIEFPKAWEISNESTAVGAVSSNNKAAIILGVEQAGLSPEEAGKKFVKDLDKKYHDKLTDAKAYDLNGNKGYIVEFTEISKKDTMYAYALWLQIDSSLIKLMGIGPLDYLDTLKTSAASLRSLTTEEKKSINKDVLIIVKAQKGETIATLSKRTKNKLNLKLTALINDHKIEDKLTEGEQLKIVSEIPYFVE